MDKLVIQEEIEKLIIIKSKWSRTRKDRQIVRDLLSSISTFNHTFEVVYKYGQQFYQHNSRAEISITDGIKDLEYYANSKLKVKDNGYYYSGMENIKDGIDLIVDGLKKL